MFNSIRRSLSGIGLASSPPLSPPTDNEPRDAEVRAEVSSQSATSDQVPIREASQTALPKVYGILVMETKTGQETARFSVQWEETSIGRSCKNDIRMYEPSVSLRHCRLLFRKVEGQNFEQPYLHITGTHGVAINGKKHGPSDRFHSLNGGDLLKINKFYLRLQLETQAEEPEMTNAQWMPCTPTPNKRRIRMSLVNAAQINTPARQSRTTDQAHVSSKDIVIYELADHDSDTARHERDDQIQDTTRVPLIAKSASADSHLTRSPRRRERRKSSFYGRAMIGTELGGTAKSSPNRDFYPEERQQSEEAPNLPTSTSAPDAMSLSHSRLESPKKMSVTQPPSPQVGHQTKYNLTSSPSLPLIPPNLSPSRFNRKISLRTETLLRASAIRAEQWRQEREEEEKARCREEHESKIRNGQIAVGDMDSDDEDEVEKSLSMLDSRSSDDVVSNESSDVAYALPDEEERADLSSLSAEAAPSYRDSPAPGSIVTKSELPAASSNSRAAPSSPSPLHPPQKFLTPQVSSRTTSSAAPRSGRKSTGTVVRVARGSFGEILPALSAMKRDLTGSDLASPPCVAEDVMDIDEVEDQQVVAGGQDHQKESEEQREAQSFALNELFLEGEAYGTDSEGEEDDAQDDDVQDNRTQALQRDAPVEQLNSEPHTSPIKILSDDTMAMPPPPTTPLRTRAPLNRRISVPAELQTPAMHMLRHMMSTKTAAVDTPDMKGMADLFASPAAPTPAPPYGKLRQMMANVPNAEELLGLGGGIAVATPTKNAGLPTLPPPTPDLAFLRHVFALPKQSIESEPALQDLHRLFASHEESLSSEDIRVSPSEPPREHDDALTALLASPQAQKALVDAAVVAIAASTAAVAEKTPRTEKSTPRKSLRESLARRLSNSVRPKTQSTPSRSLETSESVPQEVAADAESEEEAVQMGETDTKQTAPNNECSEEAAVRSSPRKSPTKASRSPKRNANARPEEFTPSRSMRKARSFVDTAVGRSEKTEDNGRVGEVLVDAECTEATANDQEATAQAEEHQSCPSEAVEAPSPSPSVLESTPDEKGKTSTKEAATPSRPRSRLPTSKRAKASPPKELDAAPVQPTPESNPRKKADQAEGSSSSSPRPAASPSPSKIAKTSPRKRSAVVPRVDVTRGAEDVSDTSASAGGGLMERQINIQPQMSEDPANGKSEEGAKVKSKSTTAVRAAKVKEAEVETKTTNSTTAVPRKKTSASALPLPVRATRSRAAPAATREPAEKEREAPLCTQSSPIKRSMRTAAGSAKTGIPSATGRGATSKAKSAAGAAGGSAAVEEETQGGKTSTTASRVRTRARTEVRSEADAIPVRVTRSRAARG